MAGHKGFTRQSLVLCGYSEESEMGDRTGFKYLESDLWVSRGDYVPSVGMGIVEVIAWNEPSKRSKGHIYIKNHRNQIVSRVNPNQIGAVWCGGQS